NNRYCQSNNLADIQTMIDQASTIQQLIRAFGTRYLKLNLSSYQRHGTVEFRHHSGTVNYTKIKNWILICARLVEASKQGIIIHDTKQFLNENLQEYFEERQLDFA
ncbi:MAG: amidoligase family protein, partial [Weeksellaceae bacterium]|nr:amidoligase family protein [Weeksellaceae bacterium]